MFVSVATKSKQHIVLFRRALSCERNGIQNEALLSVGRQNQGRLRQLRQDSVERGCFRRLQVQEEPQQPSGLRQ